MIIITGRMNNCIVIPAFNEAKTIESVLRDLNRENYSIIVVDDGSTDDTASIARSCGVFVIRHMINRGQGAALKTGITFALMMGADFIVTFDADGQHKSTDAKALLTPLHNRESDVTLGSRYLRSSDKTHVPGLRRFLHKLAVIYTNMTTGLSLTDTHNGLRGFTRSAAQKITFYEDRMEHASEILEDIARKKIQYQEVPVTVEYSEYSKGKGQKTSDVFLLLIKLLINKLK